MRGDPVQLVRLACINDHSDGTILFVHKENAKPGRDATPKTDKPLRFEGKQKAPPKDSITTQSSIPVRLDEAAFTIKGVNLLAGEPDSGWILEHLRDVFRRHLADTLR